MKITVEHLTLQYGDNVAVRDLDLEIGDGESLVLLGQSGCGKTSTMRCIAGLETPNGGRITIGDDVLFDADRGINRSPNKRNIGMVFQSYAIWPHMTVFENVAFGLKMKGVGRADVKARVMETLELVGLDGFADRGASALSGGQMQRVALARSVVMRPSVLLLDEPLSNLDARLRHRLRGDLRELQQSLGLTSVYVTHDQEEALALADRIAMMQHGRIVQIGSPDEIYAKPLSASIADFLGVANILSVSRKDETHVGVDGTDVVLEALPFAPLEELRACVRAEDIDVREGEPESGEIRGTVVSREFLGPTATYRIALSDDVDIELTRSKQQRLQLTEGDVVSLSIAPDSVQVLPLDVVNEHWADTPTSSLQEVG
ncbi:MAG TPA: ABC transporter ATP-binding protein [Candidatus Agrococcus pullicola]|uniref:ABC transporter ATP-binding protein n=1 Tax=Candidatus Agrococcus pullicola TaxID=2838429 RepID=A0A9D1YVY4_9MICO|nr:ABC transporter ATP-binding protein [Candidatus Agrococcus pullicola]